MDAKIDATMLPDVVNDQHILDSDAPNSAKLASNDNGHAGAQQKHSEHERMTSGLSDRTSDTQTSFQQTLEDEKTVNETELAELSSLQTFVVVLAICVSIMT
jgi:hypothetical protein